MAAPLQNWDQALNSFVDVALKSNSLDKVKKLSTDIERIIYLRRNIYFDEIEWIKNYFEQCNKLHRKCKETAAAERLAGNQLFQKKKYRDAVDKYTQAIIHGPFRTEELALAFGNRSATWFHLKEYKNSLEDIGEAIKNDYPIASQYKLEIRQAHCYYQLQDWAASSKAMEKFFMLMETETNITEKRRGELKKEAGDLRSKLEKARLKGRHISKEDTCIPPVSYGTNPILVQASGAIDLMCNDTQGRYLVANKDIKAGDTLIVERPYAAVLLPDHYRSHCHHCFRLLHSVYPCRQCTMVKYCSPHCEEGSWLSYHQIECPYLDLLHSVGIAHLSLRIILVAGLKFLLDFRLISERLRKDDRIAGLNEHGKYERNYLTVYDLMTHTEDMTSEDLYQYSSTALLLLKILQHSGWFGPHKVTISESVEKQDTNECEECDGKEPTSVQKCVDVNESSEARKVNKDIDTCSYTCDENSDNNVKAMSNLHVHCDSKTSNLETDTSFEQHSTDSKCSESMLQAQTNDSDINDIDTYIGGLLLRHIQQLVCNAHAITEVQVTPAGEGTLVEETSQVRVATAIYPTASLMNHSCDPTIISSFYKDTLNVRAVKDVKAGGEIFNCYGPHCKRMRRNERQQCLREQYFFTCTCQPCVNGVEEEAIFSSFCCPECTGPMCKIKKQLICRTCQYTGDKIQKLEELAEKANDLFSQAVLLLQQQNYKDAITVVTSCYKLRKKLLYKHNKELAETQDCLARCYAMTGQFREASKYLLESIQTVKVIYGSESIELANELRKLSEVLISSHDWKHALEVTKEAIQIFTLHYGKSHDSVKELCAAESELRDLL